MAHTTTLAYTAGASASTPTFTHRLNVLLDSSYSTGGYLLGLQNVIGKGKTIIWTSCQGVVTSSGAPDTKRYQYDATNDKLYAIKADGSGEVTATTDLSTITVRMAVTSY